MREDSEGKLFKFHLTRSLRYVRVLGHGGTGETRLFLDEDMGLQFAIKKYAPCSENNREECYRRFVDEIKILYTINHPNIVRIFSYYLFKSEKVGFIQMEFINGQTIDQISPQDYGKTWNDYFISVIDAFAYLHEINILHRDIRPSNFMIDSAGVLKIIDFGFGKKIDTNTGENSILLNWPATIPPEEITTRQEYNFGTEIYFIGVLFKHLIREDGSFMYRDVLNKMTQISPEQRFKTCEDIKIAITNNFFHQISFRDTEKQIYSAFANKLDNIILEFTAEPKFCHDSHIIQNSLEKIVRRSAPELYVHACYEIVQCFVNTPFRYRSDAHIKTESLVSFYSMFINMSQDKQDLIVDSIIARFKDVRIAEQPEIPF